MAGEQKSLEPIKLAVERKVFESFQDFDKKIGKVLPLPGSMCANIVPSMCTMSNASIIVVFATILALEYNRKVHRIHDPSPE